MSFWVTLWQICLIIALVMFASMALLVSVGGMYDIMKLIRRLKEDEGESTSTDMLQK